MLAESRVWRAAATAAVLVSVFGNPVVGRNLRRLFVQPGYADSKLVMVDRNTVHYGGAGTVPRGVFSMWAANRSFAEMAQVERWVYSNGVHAERVAPRALAMTGVQAWRGRLLTDLDSDGAVLTYEFARGDAGLIGQTIPFGLYRYRVVGILPPGFQLLARETAVFVLLPWDVRRLEFVGRLRPGVGMRAARDDLRRLSHSSWRFGAGGLELITLRENRRDDLRFAISALRWNLAFVVLAAGLALYRFLRSRERKISTGQQVRFLGFLLVKTCVLLGALALVWVVLSDLTGTALVLAFLLFAWGVTGWSLRDQQIRCRTCCQRLRMPVDSGRWSSLVLDRPRTEWICAYGHGTLYVPGTRLLDLDSVNWTPHRDLWTEISK